MNTVAVAGRLIGSAGCVEVPSCSSLGSVPLLCVSQTPALVGASQLGFSSRRFWWEVGGGREVKPGSFSHCLGIAPSSCCVGPVSTLSSLVLFCEKGSLPHRILRIAPLPASVPPAWGLFLLALILLASQLTHQPCSQFPVSNLFSFMFLQ